MSENLLDNRLQNRNIKESLPDSISKLFPITQGSRVLSISNINIEDNLSETDFPAQREVKLQRKNWEMPITADIEIFDKDLNKVISKRDGVKIGAVPKLTNRFSAIIQGNEYQVFNQIRRKSGVYSRVRRNGELESEFNLEKGANFSIEIDPVKQIFYLSLSSSSRRYRLYSLLVALGKSDEDLKEVWGENLLVINKKGALNTQDSELSDIYKKVTKKDWKGSSLELRKALQEYFNSTKMSGEVTEITLGNSFESANADAMLAASKKLVKINKNEEDPDDRDSLIFKNIYTPDDLLKEYFAGHAPQLQKKMSNALRVRDNVREVIPANAFSKPIESFFTTSDLASTPPQTNPVSMAVNSRKTTPMGEGGIQNSHSITMETRDVHPSQIGFLDPLSTPESEKVGVTVGLTSEVVKIDGEMKAPVVMPDGTFEYKSTMEMYKSVVGLPDQFKLVDGKPVPISDNIKVLNKHKPDKVSKEKVDFYIKSPGAMFDFAPNLMPWLQTTQANRASTGSRMITQALPIDNPDTPLSAVYREQGNTYEDLMGTYLLPSLEKETGKKGLGGVVESVGDEYIHIKADDGNNYKIGLFKNFPLNEDGFLHTEAIVKEGDRVESDDLLAKSNYTNNEGRLALGKNLTVAYISYKGNSFEDAATITESAAKKLSHTSVNRLNLFHNPKNSTFNLKKYRATFPEDITPANARKLDSKGMPKIGESFSPGEYLVAFLVKKEADDLDQALKKLNKATYSPYSRSVLQWDDDDQGEVVDVRVVGRNIDVYVKSVHSFREGDKVSSRYGDKHIIGKIIPDDEAPHRPDGTPVDIMVNPQGVQGRMNMGQMIDTAAGKIALKRGKPYETKNFSNPEGDDAKAVYDEMVAEGIEANEILTDGKTGQPIENPVYVGNRQYYKLRHLVKKKSASHGYGSYDIDEQPAGKGAQRLDLLSSYAHMAHGANNLLREASEIKSRKNEEYMRNLQFGLPPSRPNSNFMFDKMLNYMMASGVDVKKNGHMLQLAALTDDRITELSKGEIPDPGAMLIGKNLGSKKGGLFDPELTGGQRGENYTHITLPDKIPNPMAEVAIKSVLGLTNKAFDDILKGNQELNGVKGPKAIVKALSDIDVKKELEKTKSELNSAPQSAVNKLNLKARILKNLDQEGLSADKAFSNEKFLIIPPKFRPVYPLPSGDLQVSDINKHYRDVGLKVRGLQNAKKENLITPEEEISYHANIYETLKASQGFTDPQTYGKQKYKGALKDLGDLKKGLIFGKAWSKRQDLSGRSTITPEPSLGLDEIGIPENMAYTIFEPFTVRKLKQSGMTAVKAKQEVKNRTDISKSALMNVMREKPVIVNRAPSLHKHSVQAFKPTLVSGKDIRINPMVVSGYGADFDGDTMSVMVPVTYEGEQDARSMMPSRILFKHGDNGLVPSLSQEYIFGVSKLSEFGKETGKTFNSVEEAKEAGLKMTDVFKLDNKKMTIGQWELNKSLPDQYKDYTRTFKRKDLPNLLSKIAKNEPSEVFADVIDNFKNLGASYSYRYGGTLSIEDMVFDRSYRDELVSKFQPRIEKLKTPQERVQAYNQLVKEIEDAQNTTLSGKNRMLDLIETGSLSASKAGNVRQVLSAPGIITDTQGRFLPLPILRSYSEGLDTFDYMNTYSGVRKGTVDKSVNTRESGALNKILLSATRRLLVVEEDCGTTEGREFSLDDKDVMDRTLVSTIPGVARRNDLVDSDVVLKAKNKKIEKLMVRSPLSCDSVQGVCQKCYGAMPDGKLAQIGTNVGLLEAQALTERSTQLTMQTFHTGGAAKTGGAADIQGSFPRILQLVKVPEKLSGKGTLAEVDGKVESLEQNEIGGWTVVISGKEHVIAPSRTPTVSVGNNVKRGDKISDGVIKPQELAEFKDFATAQNYIVDGISEVYGGNFFKKNMETVVRGISDNAEVDYAPEDSGLLRGDKKSTSYLKRLNRERAVENLEPIKYTPYFKSVDTLNVDNEDWGTRITTNRIKDGLAKGMARGDWANLAGKDPVLPYLYGDDFGKPEKKIKDQSKGFY